MSTTWIPKYWWWFFTVELCLCMCTCLIWFANPAKYIQGTLGVTEVVAVLVGPLLWEQANVVICVYVIFLAFVLYSHPYNIPERVRTLTWLAMVMTIGDIGVIVLTLLSWHSNVSYMLVIPKLVLAALFGAIRTLYVLEHQHHI